MPRPKQRSSAPRNEDSDEDVVMTQNLTQTQASQGPSMTQAEKTLNTMSDEDVDRKVNDLVQFFLIMDQKKIPIKRQDINKHVLKEHNRAFPQFIDKASEKLKNIFGIQLTEISSKQKSYILVNSMDTDVDYPHLAWPDDDNAKLGLITVILSIIFMSGNSIEESKLYATLKKLGVDIEQGHEIFGDVKKYIVTDLVKQGYLLYERQGLSDPPAYDFKWGARAKHETSKRNILDFVCQVYGDTDPSKWTSQWTDMMQSEGAQSDNDE